MTNQNLFNLDILTKPDFEEKRQGLQRALARHKWTRKLNVGDMYYSYGFRWRCPRCGEKLMQKALIKLVAKDRTGIKIIFPRCWVVNVDNKLVHECDKQ